MPTYLLQVRYMQQHLQALIENPQDRVEAARKIIEANGGTLHQLYFAFGDYDVVAISEFPDQESAAATAMTVGAFGPATKTTVLLTPDEAVSAMRKAKETRASYSPPGGSQ